MPADDREPWLLRAPLFVSAPGLVRAPNPGLMTLTGTNSWVLPGRRGTIVVDPGPRDPAHAAELERHGTISAVLLTHRHEDHSADLALLDDRIPVHAADPELARGAEPLAGERDIEVDGRRVRVLQTPGHTSDSVCFGFAAGRAHVLCTGDTLLGGRNASSIARGGSLSEHLRSLARLASFTGVRGLPGHGPAIPDVGSHARGALAHRMRRLRGLRDRIRAEGAVDPGRLAEERHPLRADRWSAATRMIEHELDYLRREAGLRL